MSAGKCSCGSIGRARDREGVPHVDEIRKENLAVRVEVLGWVRHGNWRGSKRQVRGP